MKMVAVVQVTLAPEWFRLELAERQKLRRYIFALVENHRDLEVRWFDADPWTGGGTEFLVCEFGSLTSYWSFWNDLRDALLSKSYASFDRVSLGYERSLTVGLVDT